MFSVPGWSVSPRLLQSQREPPSTKNKKRPLVTPENVADLWMERIERRMTGGLAKEDHQPKEVPRKRQKLAKSKGWRVSLAHDQDESIPKISADPIQRADKASKKVRKPIVEKASSKIHRPRRQEPSLGDSGSKSDIDPTASGLTPLQDSMRRKLTSARFRYLNETLYTSPSADAKHLFESDPSMFEDYHTGFGQQVSSWPQNPVDCFARDLEARGKDLQRKKYYGRDASVGKEQVQWSQWPRLPRTKQICTVADLGCGDAGLAKMLQPLTNQLKIRILSYDLQSSQPHVIKADIAHLPLQDGEVDVAIFCLALMGTNWTNFIDEAWRVLRWRGELWIAEIKSRFNRNKARSKTAHESKRQKKIKTGQSRSNADEPDSELEESLKAEVDGLQHNRAQEDIGPFVNILRRRGFNLQDEAAIDTSNKMFVRMRFVKNVPPTKGKNQSRPQGGTASRTQSKSYKWGQPQEEPDSADEAKILKPCLYKQR